MAFTSVTAYQNARDSAWQRLAFSKVSLTTTAGRLYSSWRMTAGDPAAGAAPGATAISYTSATTGALTDLNANVMRDSVGTARVVKMAASFATSPGAGCVQLCDRLSGISGFSGLTTGTITCNTIASSRYATGAESVGILAAVEIYTTLGNVATPTVNLLTYTDETGTANLVGQPVVIGVTGFTEVGRLLLLPPVSGGRGIRSVETINRTTAAAAAGDYGVTVYKPLVTMPIFSLGPAATEEETESLGYVMPKIVAGACLFFSLISSQASTGIFHGEVSLGEE